MFKTDSWAPSGAVRSWSFSPLMSVLWFTCVFAVTAIDWVSCSRAENFVIFTVFWTMYWTYVTIEVSVLFNTKVGVLATIFIDSSWTVYVIGWANGGAV